MISEKLLVAHGAKEIVYAKGEPILYEGQNARYYFQITFGEVKMYNITEDGKEFIQGIFEKGMSFAEPPLLGDFPYPASALANEKTELLRLSKKKFTMLLKEQPEIHLKFTTLMCIRLKYKAMIMKEVSVYPPQHRILTLLSYLKQKESPSADYIITLTRQQIADLTGLRVETVIRTIKLLVQEKKLRLQDRKIIL